MPSFNIVLTSGGFNDIYNYVSDENIKFFRNICSGKKVLIIANAAPEGTGNYLAREKVKANLLEIGSECVDIIDLTYYSIRLIHNYDVIYVMGGDPYFLIELSSIPEFKPAIIQFLKSGIYIGESAGSMILCDDLKWAYIAKKGTKPKYDIQLETYKGLGLVPYRIFPHWNKVIERVKAKVESIEKENKIDITRLNDGEIIKTRYP